MTSQRAAHLSIWLKRMFVGDTATPDRFWSILLRGLVVLGLGVWAYIESGGALSLVAIAVGTIGTVTTVSTRLKGRQRTRPEETS